MTFLLVVYDHWVIHNRMHTSGKEVQHQVFFMDAGEITNCIIIIHHSLVRPEVCKCSHCTRRKHMYSRAGRYDQKFIL